MEQICEDLWPGVRRFQVGQRLHTAASNLRHLLAAAAGAGPGLAGEFVAKQQGRCRLSRALVEVDLWRLKEAVAAARAGDQNPGRRQEALARACEVYGGPLADGCGYGWVGVYREQVRTWASYAHRELADTTGDPHRAARLLARAAQIDPADEDTCRQAMRACARVGDPAGIRRLLDDLTEHLDTTGGEPGRATVDLAGRLLHDIGQPPPQTPDRASPGC